jgi:pimeloyl-ACP methyl ester carboxylesterase
LRNTYMGKLVVLMTLSTALLLVSPDLSADNVSAPAPSGVIIGDWDGSLTVPGGSLPLVFHFTKTTNVYSGTLDSTAQGAFGIPCGTVVFDGTSLTVAVPSVHGTFTGKMSSDGLSITGTWSQGSPLPLTLTKITAAGVPSSSLPVPTYIAGNWQGTLTVQGTSLQLVLHFVISPNGVMTATLDSPDQGAFGMPAGTITCSGTILTVTVPKVDGHFSGTLGPNHDIIVGTWTQRAGSLPLTIKRTTKTVELPDRPQNPKPPYPYVVRDVTFPSVDKGVILAGSLTMPRNATNAPGVVLISGSGPNDRDEDILGHKIFAVIADYLTRRGFVVLRYDKRGVGKSGGNYATATTFDFGDDAQSAVTFLSKTADVDHSKIGLIGHSEGGMIAPMVAARDHQVKFVVLLAGPGVKGIDVLLRQQVLIAEGEGASAHDIALNQKFQEPSMKIAMNSKGSDADRAAVVAIYEKVYSGTAAPAVLAGQIASAVQTLFMPWFQSFLAFDPQRYLTQVTVPLLALNGSKDRQVDPNQNLPAIRSALETSDHGRFTITQIPGLNHLFQDCKTGAFSEYNTIAETFSPKALKIMGDWLVKTTGGNSHNIP